MSGMLGQMRTNSDQPSVEITEQPRARGIRFRYECEGRSAGSIPGEHSTTERKTYPAVKLHNHTGAAIVVVSCVTKDPPYKPHPHSLVGKDCNKGVCTVKLKNTNVITFPSLGIQCAKKRDVVQYLEQRKQIRVDPFGTGFKHIEHNKDIDLGVVRLCFQVFLPDSQGKYTRIVQPVVSQPIYDRKTANELVICRIDRHSGRVRGGDEVFLLCEKVSKDDIEVRFYEETPDGQLVWEAFGDFGSGDVHRQFAIVFKTPPYRDQYISQPVTVLMQLRRPGDGELSDPKPFQYMPEDNDPEGITKKRKRRAFESAEALMNDLIRPAPSIKKEPVGATLGLTSEDVRSLLKSNIESKNKNQQTVGPMEGIQDLNMLRTTTLGLQQPLQQQVQVSMPKGYPTQQGYATAVAPQPMSTTPSAAPVQTISAADVSGADVHNVLHDLQVLQQLQQQTSGATTQPGMVPVNMLDSQSGLSGLLSNMQGAAANATMNTIVFGEGDQKSNSLILSDSFTDVDLQKLLGSATFDQLMQSQSFQETPSGLSGDLLQAEHDPNVAAHENVISGEEPIMVSDPAIRGELERIRLESITKHEVHK